MQKRNARQVFNHKIHLIMSYFVNDESKALKRQWLVFIFNFPKKSVFILQINNFWARVLCTKELIKLFILQGLLNNYLMLYGVGSQIFITLTLVNRSWHLFWGEFWANFIDESLSWNMLLSWALFCFIKAYFLLKNTRFLSIKRYWTSTSWTGRSNPS